MCTWEWLKILEFALPENKRVEKANRRKWSHQKTVKIQINTGSKKNQNTLYMYLRDLHIIAAHYNKPSVFFGPFRDIKTNNFI